MTNEERFENLEERVGRLEKEFLTADVFKQIIEESNKKVIASFEASILESEQRIMSAIQNRFSANGTNESLE